MVWYLSLVIYLGTLTPVHWCDLNVKANGAHRGSIAMSMVMVVFPLRSTILNELSYYIVVSNMNRTRFCLNRMCILHEI